MALGQRTNFKKKLCSSGSGHLTMGPTGPATYCTLRCYKPNAAMEGLVRKKLRCQLEDVTIVWMQYGC